MKKVLWFLIPILLFCASFVASAAEETLIVDVEEYFNNTVVPQNQSDEDPFNDDIKIRFNKFTRTLTVSGEGIVDEFFPRDWDSTDGSFKKTVTNKTIRRLIIEEGITDVYNSFNDLHGIKEIRLPQSLENIVDSFNGSTALRISKISNDAALINNSFNDSGRLKKIRISGGFSIQDSFNNCISLERIDVVDSQTIQNTFNNAAALKSVELSAKDISYCFRNSDSLTKANLSLTSVYDSFDSCPRLKRVFVAPLLQDAKYSFDNCPILKEIQRGEKTYTILDFWEKYAGRIDYSRYEGKTGDSGDCGITAPKEPNDAIGGGMILLIGLGIILVIFIIFFRSRKKKGDPANP